MEPKKSKPIIVTFADPFADVAAEVWAELGIEQAPPEEAVAPETPPETTPPVIEIHDEADMALASWLYLDEKNAPAESPAPPPAAASPTEAELLDWLLAANKPAS